MGWVTNDPSGPYFEEELFLSLEGVVFVHRLVELLVDRNFRVLSSRLDGALEVFRLGYPEGSPYVDIHMEGDPNGWSIVASFQDRTAVDGVLAQGAKLRFFRTFGPDQHTTPDSALRAIELVFKEV